MCVAARKKVPIVIKTIVAAIPGYMQPQLTRLLFINTVVCIDMSGGKIKTTCLGELAYIQASAITCDHFK